MDISIGIPNSISTTPGVDLLEWARRADRAGFISLASIGAVSYPSYEELTVFAAAAAVTGRIRFMTNVLLAPTRSAAELAKQAATVDAISGGRLTLGLGVGWRASDFGITGRDHRTRGAAFDRMLVDLKRAWAGEALTEDSRPPSPRPVQDPLPLLIGGTTDAAIRRVVEHGIGWTAGGMPPDAVAEFAGRVRTAWTEAGREGSPRITALLYFGLGDTEAESRGYLLDYYQPMGPDVANMIAGSAARSVEAVQGAKQAYAAAGVDELVFDPSVGHPDQVDLLAEAVLG